MTTHYLYQGGANQQNPGFGLYPAATPTPSTVILPAAHRAPIAYAIESVYDFGAEGGALAQYIADNTTGALLETPGATAQDIVIALLPIKHKVEEVFYEVITAGPAGLTFDLRRVEIQTPPTEPTLVGSAIATGISGAATGSNVYNVDAYVTVPQAIVLRINTVPAGGMGNFKVAVSAVVKRFKTGY
jgi:hypothetical protein